MTGPGSDATLSIEVTTDGRLYSLLFRGYGQGNVLSLHNVADLDDLKGLRDVIGRDLADFKDIIGGRLEIAETEIGVVNDALSHLQVTGEYALATLLGSEVTRSRDVKIYAIE